MIPGIVAGGASAGVTPPPGPPFAADRSMHFDASDLSTLTLDGSFVDGWECKATGIVWGNTGSNRPARSTSVFAAGSLQFVNAGANRWLHGDPITVPTPFTAFLVTHFPVGFEQRSLGLYVGEGNFVSVGTPVPYLVQYASVAGSGYAQMRLTTAPSYALSSDIAGPSTKVLAYRAAGVNPSNWTVEQNRVGVTASQVGSDGPTSQTFESVGSSDSSYPSNGDVAEILIYNRTLSGAEMTEVYDYLSDKWGTP